MIFQLYKMDNSMLMATDYGHPMKPFFVEIPNFWAWADELWDIWDIFGWFISTHFGTVIPLSMFSINQPLFLQKAKPLYPHPKYLSGLGFEFVTQIIMDLAFVCP